MNVAVQLAFINRIVYDILLMCVRISSLCTKVITRMMVMTTTMMMMMQGNYSSRLALRSTASCFQPLF